MKNTNFPACATCHCGLQEVWTNIRVALDGSKSKSSNIKWNYKIGQGITE
jgi:hypothetical protein